MCSLVSYHRKRFYRANILALKLLSFCSGFLFLLHCQSSCLQLCGNKSDSQHQNVAFSELFSLFLCFLEKETKLSKYKSITCLIYFLVFIFILLGTVSLCCPKVNCYILIPLFQVRSKLLTFSSFCATAVISSFFHTFVKTFASICLVDNLTGCKNRKFLIKIGFFFPGLGKCTWTLC